MTSRTENTLATRLEKHPALKARFEAILDLAENTHGDLISADEAEQRAIEQVRRLGNEILHDWAEQRVIAAADELKEKNPAVVGNGQKK